MKLKSILVIFLLIFLTACGVENGSVSISTGDNSSSSGSTGNGGNNGGNTGGDNGETTLYYTINFYANLGEGNMQSVSVIQGESVQLPVNKYTREGFVFKGWSTVSTGIVEYNDKEIITPNGDMSLYAVWEEVSYYTITLHSATSEEETITLNVSSSDMPYKLPKNTFVNGDKKFTGWKSDIYDYKFIDGYADLVLSSNIDLYATWHDSPVTITFNPVGGTGDMPAVYAVNDDKIKVPVANFTKEGYELKGTYTFDLVTYGFGSILTVPNKDVDLYTVWIELPKPPDPVFGGNSETYKNITVWVNGVNVKESDWILTNDKQSYVGLWREDAGWYNTNQGKYNLCWAAVSSNFLHWWHDRNKVYIDKYFAENNSNRPDTAYLGFGKSNIFELYKNTWPNKGNHVDVGVEWFIAGVAGNITGGAYYKDVFGDNFNLVEVYTGVTQYSFNKALDKAFNNGMIIAASERNALGSHVFTVWGAHFDDKGLVDKIYYTDSMYTPGSSTSPNLDTGLSYIDINYDNVTGKVSMKTKTGGFIPLNAVTLFSDGEKEWKEFFETQNK